MEIKKYIENLKDCLNKLKFTKDAPFSQPDTSKDSSKKKLNSPISPTASAANLKPTTSTSPSESPLELVAYDIQSSNGILHPDIICFNPKIFHLFGNESNCGRQGIMTKTIYHINTTDEVNFMQVLLFLVLLFRNSYNFCSRL